MSRLLPAIVIVLTLAAPSSAFDVVFCGQSVPRREIGVLQADLSCGATAGVVLGAFAELEMNGHQISGGSTGVLCTSDRCEIRGPGTITGSSSCGVQPGNNVGRVVIDLSGITIDSTGCAVAGSRAKDIRLRLADVTVTNNNSGLSAGRITGKNVIVTGNGSGGIDGRRYVRLVSATIQDNNGIGLIGRTGAALRDSTVTNNDPATGYDIATNRSPRLRGTSCGHSVVIPDPFVLPDAGAPSWGVCAGD